MKQKKTPAKKTEAGSKGSRSNNSGDKANSDSSDFLKFDKEELKKLIKIVEKSGVEELEISRGSGSVRIRKPSPFHGVEKGRVMVEAYQTSQAAASGETAGGTGEAVGAKTELVPIKSPMVGTFYRAPAPDADQYTETGAFVEVGQVVCIVEAMKLMNEIESDIAGKIVEIPVQNGQPVEYGQALFLVDVKARK